MNDGNCNVNAESVPITSLDARADAHAATRRAAAPGPTPGTAPAAALDLDARGLDVALLVSVVKDDIASAVPVDALDRSRVEFTSVLELGLAFVALANLRRRGAPVVVGIRVQRLDEFLLHARLALAIVVGDVVGPIAPVPVDLARIELTSAACEL